MNNNELVTQEQATPQQPTVRQDKDGKFKSVVEYKKYSSIKPKTREEAIELFNMLNDPSHDKVTPLKNAVNAKIKLTHIITNPYRSVNEETGEITDGVTTMMFDESGNAFATSSKSVYWTLMNAFDIFGYPGLETYEPIILQVFEYTPKGTRNKALNVKLIG